MNRRWIWIALVGALAAAQWGLYLDATAQRASAGRTEAWKPAESARAATRREVLSTAEAIALHERLDTYATAAVAAHRVGRAIDVGPEWSTSRHSPGEHTEAADRRARAQLEVWGLDAPRVAVGLYLPEDDEGWPANVGRPSGMSPRGRILTGTTDDGSPYCIQLGAMRRGENRSVDLPWALDRDATSGPGTFGACWLYARYGLPGPGVDGWMKQTGLEAAIATTTEGIWSVADVDDPGSRLMVAMGARESMSLAGGTHTRAELCARGEAEHCATLFLHPTASSQGSIQEFDRFNGTFTVVAAEEAVAPGTVPLLWEYNPLGEDWLFRLEQEHGADRMAAFWTSPETDVTRAFEAAFGVEPALAVMDEVRARIGTGATGPTVPVWGWIGLVLAIATGIGLSAIAADRRRIA